MNTPEALRAQLQENLREALRQRPTQTQEEMAATVADVIDQFFEHACGPAIILPGHDALGPYAYATEDGYVHCTIGINPNHPSGRQMVQRLQDAGYVADADGTLRKPEDR